MNRLAQKTRSQSQRHRRVRSRVSGSANRPRLSVKITARHVSAQLIDDDSHHTLFYITTVGQKALVGGLTQKAEWVGTQLAKKTNSKKIKKVVFDRGSRLYHGRVKALAEAARAGGLEF